MDILPDPRMACFEPLYRLLDNMAAAHEARVALQTAVERVFSDHTAHQELGVVAKLVDHHYTTFRKTSDPRAYEAAETLMAGLGVLGALQSPRTAGLAAFAAWAEMADTDSAPDVS